MSGWIKLYRSTLEWEWFKNHKTAHLFSYCLLKANFKEARFQGLIIPAGSFVTGRKVMSLETGLSEQEIRTALVNLKSTSNITIKSTSKYSIISIVNWSKYQEDQPACQPTSNQQSTTIEERKKDKKERSTMSDFSFDEFWKIYPKQRAGSKSKALPRFQEKVNEYGLEKIMEGVKAYSASEEVKRGFAKNCAAWLNDDRFLSQYEPVKKARPDGYAGM